MELIASSACPPAAGKMAVLGVLLQQSIAVAGDRVVVVSQSTAALDLVQVRAAPPWLLLALRSRRDVHWAGTVLPVGWLLLPCPSIPPCSWLPPPVLTPPPSALPQKLCDGRGWRTARIDGATDVSKRQDVVNAFNNYNVGQARQGRLGACLLL